MRGHKFVSALSVFPKMSESNDGLIAVKANGETDSEYKLRVLGLPHGVDRQGQIFDASTDLGDANEIPVYYWHGYGEQSAKAVRLIGRAIKSVRDAEGLWFDVVLKKGEAIAQKIYDDAAKGLARASSDSVPHLVRPLGLVGKPGKITSWPILALSLMDADTASTAVNPQAIAVPALKALYEEFMKGMSASAAGMSDEEFLNAMIAHHMTAIVMSQEVMKSTNSPEIKKLAQTIIDAQSPEIEQMKQLLKTLPSGEVVATKAGATFARRNRERIEAISKLLDEMKGEFPDESSSTPQTFNNIVDTTAAKSESELDGGITDMEGNEILSRIESMIDLKFTMQAQAEAERKRVEAEKETAAAKAEAEMKARVDAAMEAKLTELNAEAVKAGRPALFGTQAQNNTPNDEAAAKVFKHYMFTGDKSQLNAAKATMNETTAGQGGYLVPTMYSNEIVKALTEGSILRVAGARVLTVGGTNSFKVPTLSNTTRAVKIAESVAFSQVEPTLSEVTFTPLKYTRLSKVTDELLADSRIDTFSQVIAPDAANAFVLAENEDFTIGDGVGDPQGVMVGASLGVTAASATAITTDEVINLYHSVSYLYRANAVWMMNDATVSYIRRLKDTTNQYLWQPGLQAGQPPTLLGRPVFTNNNMATIATGNRTVLFGDMSYFWIADFAQLEMRRLDELYAGTGEVGFRWFKRYDSRVMLSSAIKYLVQA